jgi:hypothetical protein
MISGMRAARPTAEEKLAQLIEVLSQDPGVTVGGGKGFGSGALKIDGKIFAMMSSKNQFVVKLSGHRVDALVASGAGKRFAPRPGRVMKEWLVVTAEGTGWVELAQEARDFVKRGKP